MDLTEATVRDTMDNDLAAVGADKVTESSGGSDTSTNNVGIGGLVFVEPVFDVESHW